MKIIILGAGQVGGTLAENLVGENNDITVVDKSSERLRELQDKYDLRVVQGFASHPDTLREAGAQDADMLVAVTNSDETNMIASMQLRSEMRLFVDLVKTRSQGNLKIYTAQSLHHE